MVVQRVLINFIELLDFFKKLSFIKMKLKQTAFDFDFPAEEPKKVETTIIKEKPAAVVIEKEIIAADPIEVDLTPVVFKERKSALKKSTRGRMKLSDMNAELDSIAVPDDEVLFSKRYYSIGIVSEMFNVNHSLIRFWENEFDILKPKKNGKGDRLFRPEDIKNLKLIYHLLREKKYTIEGAKEFLKKSKSIDKKFEMIESLKELKGFLLEIKAGL